MEKTVEQLELENQGLRERIKELEAVEKEHTVLREKELHDQWAGRGRKGSKGVIKK